jgi:hypothetical protein
MKNNIYSYVLLQANILSNPLFILGSISFEGLEVPERVLLKTKHRLVVHKLGSGSSLIDSLGEDVEVVTFNGIFSGINAVGRIRLIEQLRSQGTPIGITWAAKTLSVIIQEFNLNYSSNQWITYQASCYVTGSANPDKILPTDEVLGSANTQADDIVGLLQGTDISPTAGQTTAIIALAALNYDIAPSDALQHANALLGSIDSQLESLDKPVPYDAAGGVGPPPRGGAIVCRNGLECGSASHSDARFLSAHECLGARQEC